MKILPDVPDNFQPTYLDLVLAALAGIGLPLAAAFIFNATRALIIHSTIGRGFSHSKVVGRPKSPGTATAIIMS